MAKIFIDAGHGGNDGGATANGIKEKDINLKLALKTRSYLNQYEGADVKLSREKDEYLTLKQRTDAANSWGADILVSIHINASESSSAHGFESYVYPNVNSKTQSFQNVLHDHIKSAIGIADRGKKQANFHMLRESHMTACLTENGFVTNGTEAGKMQDESWLNKVAEAHATGIAEFLGLQKKVTERPADPDKLYRVQVGAFSSRENAEKAAQKAKDAGLSAWIYED